MNEAQTVPTFTFKLRHLRFGNALWFDVWENGLHYQVTVGDTSHRHSEDWMSGLTDEQYRRDVVGRENLISLFNTSAPSKELVDAFNAWREKLHAELLDRVCSQPDRYGVIAQDDPIRKPYPVVHAASYEIGVGWVRT